MNDATIARIIDEDEADARARIVADAANARERIDAKQAGDGERLDAMLSKVREAIVKIEAEANSRAEQRVTPRFEEAARLKAAAEATQRRLDRDAHRMQQLYEVRSDQIKMNVGGTRFLTSVATLTGRAMYPYSKEINYFSGVFSGRCNVPTEKDGSYFLDRVQARAAVSARRVGRHADSGRA